MSVPARFIKLKNMVDPWISRRNQSCVRHFQLRLFHTVSTEVNGLKITDKTIPRHNRCYFLFNKVRHYDIIGSYCGQIGLPIIQIKVYWPHNRCRCYFLFNECRYYAILGLYCLMSICYLIPYLFPVWINFPNIDTNCLYSQWGYTHFIIHTYILILYFNNGHDGGYIRSIFDRNHLTCFLMIRTYFSQKLSLLLEDVGKQHLFYFYLTNY